MVDPQHCWSIPVLLSLLVGCSSSSTSQPESTPVPPAALVVKQVDQSQLPSLGDYFPPLDEGRVKLAPPADWSWGSRRQGYLVRMHLDKTRSVRLPRIWVTVEGAGEGAAEQLTPDNLVTHASFVQARLDRDGIKLLERVQPMVIGSVPCVRYVRVTRFRVRDAASESITAERQILETIQKGRQYTIDLQVHRGSLLTHRNKAYAVLAGMQFSKSMTDELEVGE